MTAEGPAYPAGIVARGRVDRDFLRMGYEAAVAAAAAGVAALFTAGLWRRYVARGRANRALVYWALSLAMFTTASAALALGAGAGWSGATFRVFYLFGGVLVVPWLALGTVHTVAQDDVTLRVLAAVSLGVGALFALPMVRADEPVLYGVGVAFAVVWGLLMLTGRTDQVRAGSVALVGTFTGVAAFAVLAGRVTTALPAAGVPEGSEVFEAGVRGFAVGGNALGAVLVVVGSVVSSMRLWRRDARDLALGNLLIAVGVVTAATGGIFAFAGDVASHALGFGVGVTIMYAGFVRTTRAPVAARDPSVRP